MNFFHGFNVAIKLHFVNRGFMLRGGSWNNNPDNLRASNRNNNDPANRNNNNGFRCVQYPSPS
ncbi:MAG: SUMF1/EgtB/PvdO family nonheme iron enzyme [Nitrospinae bacterium]|nr:SUMF1/EgtB/PvdO family nonheme iron enzyme [Nitrospinota bacterium]